MEINRSKNQDTKRIHDVKLADHHQLLKLAKSHQFLEENDPDYLYPAIEPETARKLLENHQKDWEGINDYDGWYHCLKDTLEKHDQIHLNPSYKYEKEESEF